MPQQSAGRQPDDDIVEIRFTEQGKQWMAEEYGFSSWAAFWAWREANPDEYRQVYETKLAELRAEIEREEAQ